MLLELCSSRKYPCPPQGRFMEIPRGRAFQKPNNFFEQKYDTKMEFPDRWGFNLKNPLWEGYGHFLEQHIPIQISFTVSKPYMSFWLDMLVHVHVLIRCSYMTYMYIYLDAITLTYTKHFNILEFFQYYKKKSQFVRSGIIVTSNDIINNYFLYRHC